MADRVSVAVYRPDQAQFPDGSNLLLGIYDHVGHELAQVLNGADLTFFPTTLAVAQDGSIYIGGSVVPPARFLYENEYVPAVRKYHRDGVLQWSINPGAVMSDLAVDPTTGDLVMTGLRNNNGDTTHKYSPDGALLWSMDNGLVTNISGIYNFTAYGRIAVDASGSIYIACAKPGAYSPDGTAFYPYTGMLTKWTSAGVLVWEFDHHGLPKSVAVDSANSAIYYGVERAFVDTTFVDLLKIDTDNGSVLASALSFIPPYNARANEELRLVGGVLYGIGEGAYAQFDLDLVKTADWSVYNVFDLAVDTDGNHYFATSATAGSNPGTYGDFVVSDGPYWSATLVFEVNPPYVYCTRVAVIESPQLHGLHLPLSLYPPVTQGDLYTLLYAGLLVSLAAKSPRGLLDFSGRVPPQTVYRLTLTGSTPLILPMSSFQCRRTSGSTSVSAVCPSITVAQLAAINERLSGDLVIDRGLRFPDGIIQWAELLRAPLMTVRSDSGAHHSSATLEGEAVDMTANPQTRRVMGLSYDSTTNGRRHVRCAVDTYLLPGDWADLGSGDSLLVGELTYTVSPTQEAMDLMEARSA